MHNSQDGKLILVLSFPYCNFNMNKYQYTTWPYNMNKNECKPFNEIMSSGGSKSTVIQTTFPFQKACHTMLPLYIQI